MSRATSRDDSLVVFQQSARSNLCGVYALATLLCRLRFPTTPAEILKILTGRRRVPHFRGATLADISYAFSAITNRKSRWLKAPRFDFEPLASHPPVFPTLLLFEAEYELTRAYHAVVFVGASSQHLYFVDPLARSATVATHNMSVSQSLDVRPYRIIATAPIYLFDHASEAGPSTGS